MLFYIALSKFFERALSDYIPTEYRPPPLLFCAVIPKVILATPWVNQQIHLDDAICNRRETQTYDSIPEDLSQKEKWIVLQRIF